MRINEITLELYSGVLESTKGNKTIIDYTYGLVIPALAVRSKQDILQWASSRKLSGNELNKTFHKSWNVIKFSSREDLLKERILHYISTYGTNMEGEIYFPNEIVNVPDEDLRFIKVKTFTRSELIEKVLAAFASGIALKLETIESMFEILTHVNYVFTGLEVINNKEAKMLFIDKTGILPTTAVEVLRYCVYKSTGSTMLIKNSSTIQEIKSAEFNPSFAFENIGLDIMAQIFNRFKPLFLAYKNRCSSTINKIGKLSKKYHIPLVANPLNMVTQKLLQADELHWLKNATNFAIFKAICTLHNKINGQDQYVYKIRNGKSWVKLKPNVAKNIEMLTSNYDTLITFLRSRLNFANKTFIVTKGVEYALPTSEKQFVGNIPTGTRFSAKRLAVGTYWKNSGGATDLDLSSVNITGEKVGWNAEYSANDIYYSGDITNAPNGAVEYLFADKKLEVPSLVLNNVFSGSPQSKYKIVIGKGEKLNGRSSSDGRPYMMNPNFTWADISCESIESQMVLGLLFSESKNRNTFVLLNVGAGNTRVSGNSIVSRTAAIALYQEYCNPLSLHSLITLMGGKCLTMSEIESMYHNDVPLLKELGYIDIQLESLERDTFIKLLK